MTKNTKIRVCSTTQRSGKNIIVRTTSVVNGTSRTTIKIVRPKQ